MTTVTLLGTTAYGVPSGNYDGSSQDWVSDAAQAANYYRGRGSIQNVIISVTGFEGIMYVEACLDSTASAANWFTTLVYGDGSSVPISDYFSAAVQGNFTWLRVRVEAFSGGTINAVTVTY
jgi:hypothetical protein